ncbi:toxin-antitoxin system TumE family protein [Nodularia chucula]|uniref:toxin-antitoxin system TumE family protein n=1 Tax=Nodularia chucula TaxID=3093667 RepID=UPI0039C5BF68
MLIEDYFQAIQFLIESFKIVKLFNIEYEKRGLYEGFIKGNINFKNNSLLHLREFVYVEITIDRKMYSYQYMNANNNLIFRYDNTEHHRKLNLPTFPHHKHNGSEQNVIKSDAPFLVEVLQEVEKTLETA